MKARYGEKHPGSGTTNPFRGGEDWYPLNNVTWIPEMEEIEVETCETVRFRIPSDGFVDWLKQAFAMNPKYRDEVICKVETQKRQVGVRKQYDR